MSSETRETGQSSLRPPQPGPDCSTCKKPTRFMTSVFDVAKDRTHLVYTCDDCRREVWA